MNKISDRLLLYVRYGVTALSIFILVVYYIGIIEEDIPFYITYFLLICGVLAILIAAISSFLLDKKRAINTSIAMGILIIVFSLSIAFSSSSVKGIVYERFAVAPISSKIIGGLITGSIFLLGITCMLVLAVIVIEQFKKN